MNNVRIRKEDGRWYWSAILTNGRMIGSSAGSFREVLIGLAEGYDGVLAVPMVGEKLGGKWKVKICQEGRVADYILANIKQLPWC